MTFPAYPGYKDSGVEWLGKVPEHWQAIALSRVLAAPVTDGPHTTPEFLDDGVPFLSVDGIQNGKLNFEGCRYVSFEDHKEFSKKAAPRYNDLLMGKAASVGKIARVTENIEFSIWSPLALIRVDAEQCSPEFLEFCLKSSELQHQILLSSNSNTQLNIGMKDIPKLRIPLPAAQEQTQIARFLDHETARIDVLIEEQQRLIELLKEKRQAVISHAVTKGLDPTVPMKDSCVEWLGEVPAHWTVAPIKFFFEFLDGQRIPIKAEDRGAMQGDYPYYGASGIIDYVNDFIFEEDLVLVSEDGANLLMRSTPIAFVAQGKYWVNNHAHIIRPQDGSLTYWAEVIEQQDLTNYVTGSAQPKLTAEALGSIKIAVPPTGSERAAIQAFILEIDAELGALLSEAACGVRLLQERRSALISAAVTGKIDVRGWQPPASTQAPELAVAEVV